MRSFWKKAVAVVLIALLLLPGCSGPVQPVEATPTPGPTDEPTPKDVSEGTEETHPGSAPSGAEPRATATPTPTPTATPMPTPTPTATPTPTLVPLDRRNEGGDVQERLFPLLSCSPEPTATAMPLSTPNPLLEGVGKIGAMVFANCPILGWPHKLARVLGRESYHLFYIRNVYNKQYYYVTTQEGLTGYIKASQCVVLEDADIRQYFDAIEELQRTVDYYSPDAFLRELQTGTDEGSMAERIYRALGRLGLDFDPLYYRVYKKELDNEERYPRFYTDDVYNSLLFKLFNTSGSNVQYAGQRTQWEYVPAKGRLQKGDILFFTEALGKGSSGVLDKYQFVLKGPYSGALTGCGVYLGNGKVLLLRNGQLKAVAWTEQLQETLDSARRIHLEVVDEKQALIEDLIALIYDCLGTPYSNFQRTGEYSFDCSGLISWLFMRMEITPVYLGRAAFHGTNASGFSGVTDYFWHYERRIHLICPAQRDPAVGLVSLDDLQRGDLVFLRRNSATLQVGHVMMYLGEGRVIHSTRIDEEYGGTVVAYFRPDLQLLYNNALRIDSFKP